MAAPSPPRLAAAWRVEAFFYLLHSSVVAFSNCFFFLCRRLSLHDQVSCCGTQRGRPYDMLFCYFHPAIWLGKCQSILTQAQHSNEIDMVCYRIFPSVSWACSEEGPMSLGWPHAPRHMTNTCSHALNSKGPHNNGTPRPTFNDLIKHRHPFVFLPLLLFNDSCHALHPRHIWMSHCSRSYVSFKNGRCSRII